MSAISKKFSRILVCQLSRLGDVVLATPAIELMSRAYPGAEVHVLTDKRAAPLLENNPHVQVVHAVADADSAGLFRAWRTALKLTREQTYDLVVDFQQTTLTRLVALLSGAAVRIADKRSFAMTRIFYTHTGVRRPGYAARSKIDLLEPLGIEWQGERPRIYLDENDRARASTVLAELFPGVRKGNLVTMDPTQARICRCWPAGKFARLIAKAAHEHAGLVFLPLYGPGESALADAVIDRAVEEGVPPERIRRTTGVLDLRTTAACIEVARLHVGNCSLPRHLAVAVGTPSLSVMGPTDEASWTYPWRKWGIERHETVRADMACAPCAITGSEGDCGEPNCMEALEVESVAAVLSQMLENDVVGSRV